MNSWTKDKEELTRLAYQFDKSIVLKTHENKLSKSLAWINFILTFGKQTREHFLKHFAFTIGNYHFYPKEWDKEQVERTLPHEARHTWQMKKLGFGIHPLLGLPLFLLIYCFLPLPIYFSFGRFYLELDADKAYYKYLLNKEGIFYTNHIIYLNKEHRIKSLSGPAYFWAVEKRFALEEYNRMLKNLH